MSEANRRFPNVSLRKISRKNLYDILGLEVKSEQLNLIASNAQSIAEAYFNKDAWFRAIYHENVPIGFVMIKDSLLKFKNQPRHRPFYFLWRFMIDARYQNKGYGKVALNLVIEHVKSRPKANEFTLSHSQKEGNAGKFYEKLGFEYTGR